MLFLILIEILNKEINFYDGVLIKEDICFISHIVFK